eukprot:TRINITY_DN11204_c0_g1_i1.p1 TRINITY_DN11204_c0_g1~~TRINITY_DN11204_c0_g1_i1.p1  ORF type:complete len:203 (-),score=50.33 TRINITY_DN11204_c0_g1_i1:44-613(-)
MTSSTPTYQVFEVYNVGSQPFDSLKEKSLAEIRAKFTILSPVESLDQLKPDVALATLPKEGHMIVDKTQFQDMLKRKISEALKQQELENRVKRDEKIFTAMEVFESDKLAISEFLKVLINREREVIAETTRRLFEDTQLSVDEKQRQFLEALETQRKVLFDALEGPVFRSSSEILQETGENTTNEVQQA